ncbi:hypothetical protein AB0N88_05380 [Streptomyces sp. NPDC093516]|uniref:hypothetical protein n=1 Tax=Streptomyces sp. NPDC093516 TaxID=3155304 RepID=UPI003420A02C
MTAAPDEEQWSEREHAIRNLLEAAVPTPAPPPDRMVQIRRKVKRRRRRNAASAAAALAFVAAVALVQPVLRAEGPTRGGTPAASRSSSAAEGPATVRLLGRGRAVTVALPRGWHALSVADAVGGPVAFISSQAMSRPDTDGCRTDARDALRSCPPLSRLSRNDALIVLRRSDDALGKTALPTGRDSSVDSCERVGAKGKSFFQRAKGTTSADALVLLVSVCQNALVATDTTAAVQRIVDSVTAVH